MMSKRANFLFIEKDGDHYTLSMTPELQDDIGTVGFVEFLNDETVNIDDPILNLEASKTVLEIESPLAGTVVERNERAVSEPSLLNSAEKEENWIIKLARSEEHTSELQSRGHLVCRLQLEKKNKQKK